VKKLDLAHIGAERTAHLRHTRLGFTPGVTPSDETVFNDTHAICDVHYSAREGVWGRGWHLRLLRNS